jgi:2',3'-cyclic-nucleotide 2'-phosphodiesterase (5'-nucleotidase family)
MVCRTALLLLVLFFSAVAQERQLTIIHTNDLHARFQPDANGLGGLSYVAAAIRKEMNGCSHCLLLDGGDMVQGTPVSTLFKGLPSYEVANLFGFHASAIGNHEFDYGIPQLRRFIRKARFPLLCANVVDPQGRLLARPYVIRRVNSLRVAVVGLLMEDLLSVTAADLVRPYRTLPVVDTVRRYARELSGQYDVLLVLGHLLPTDKAALLESAPEVHAIISGHDHGGVKEPVVKDGRPLVNLQAYGREIGRLDLFFDPSSRRIVRFHWRRIPVDSRQLAPAPDVATVVARWEKRVSAIVDVPIGEARKAWRPPELKLLMERAMAEEMKTDLAYMNRGGVRDILPQGQILARHVWNIMPFDNLLVIGRIRGADVPAQISNGRALDPAREYTLVTSDYVAKSAHERKLAGIPDYVQFGPPGPLLRDVLIAWIRKQRVLE